MFQTHSFSSVLQQLIPLLSSSALYLLFFFCSWPRVSAFRAVLPSSDSRGGTCSSTARTRAQKFQHIKRIVPISSHFGTFGNPSSVIRIHASSETVTSFIFCLSSVRPCRSTASCEVLSSTFCMKALIGYALTSRWFRVFYHFLRFFLFRSNYRLYSGVVWDQSLVLRLQFDLIFLRPISYRFAKASSCA